MQTLSKCTWTPSLWPVLQVWVRNDLGFRISIARCFVPAQCPRGSCWCSRPSFNECDHDFAHHLSLWLLHANWEWRYEAEGQLLQGFPGVECFQLLHGFGLTMGLTPIQHLKRRYESWGCCCYSHDPLLILFLTFTSRPIINARLDLQQFTTLVVPCSAYLAERRIATSFEHRWRSTSLCGMSRKATTLVWTPSYFEFHNCVIDLLHWPHCCSSFWGNLAAFSHLARTRSSYLRSSLLLVFRWCHGWKHVMKFQVGVDKRPLDQNEDFKTSWNSKTHRCKNLFA